MAGRRSSGFTLTELLVVMVLIGVLGTMALPSLQIFSQRHRAQLMRASLRQAIQETRLLALMQRQKVILCGSLDLKTCSPQWETGWVQRSASGRILRIWDFHKERGRLNFRLFPRGRTQLVFLANGWPEVENGTFWYCPEHWRSPAWVIVLDRFGRVTEHSGDNGFSELSQQKPLMC